MALRIEITDKFFGPNDIIPIEAGRRKNFSFSTVINGGDEDLTFFLPCDWLPPFIPRLFAHVAVWDDIIEAYIWCGWLQKPRWRKERGVLTGVTFTALGYYHLCERDEFEDPIVYGPATTGVTNLYKVNVANTKEMIEHSLTKCPALSEALPNIATGVPLAEDTGSFGGSSPVNVWNAAIGFCASLGTPVIWQVIADPVTGKPYLDWNTAPSGVEYYEGGRADEFEIEVDANSFINKNSVSWGNNQRYDFPEDGDPLDETVIPAPYVIRKYTNVGQDIFAYDQPEQLAGNMYNRFSPMRITDGEGKITQTIRGAGVGNTYEPHLIRAGHNIAFDVDQIADDYYDISQGMIGHTEWTEDDCGCSFDLKAFDQLAEDARAISITRNNGQLTWAITFPDLNIPYAPLDKAPQMGQEFPTAARDLDPSASQPMVKLGQIMVAVTDADHDFGDQGGQVLPNNLPPNRFDWVGAIGSDDGISPIGINDSHLEIPMQYGFVRRVQLKAKRGQVGTLTVKIDKYKPSTATTTVDFITITIGPTPANFAQVLYATPDHVIDDGDYLIIKTTAVATGTISQATISVHGFKRWPNFPNYPKVNYSFAGSNPEKGTF